MTTKEDFTRYIYATNIAGSNKAPSYIKAVNWLCKMIEVRPFGFEDCQNVWTVTSVDRLHELYLFVLNEASKGDESAWNIINIPKSYLRDGFCSAALKKLQEFMIEYSYEQQIIAVFNEHSGDEAEISKKLDVPFDYPVFLIEGLDKMQGEDVIRSVKARLKQNIFREIVLKIYHQSCCITGLNIPEVNRASHIIPWAEDASKRLDPSNGLCLSATYDAAFDRNLISLDDDFRIIISKDITDYYTSESVNKYFISKQGDKITLPSSYFPNQSYLAKHRDKGNF